MVRLRSKQKAIQISLNGFLFLCRRRPTLPHTFACSTIGPAGLNFRVRDGNGWIPRGKITEKLVARGAKLLAVSLYPNRCGEAAQLRAKSKWLKANSKRTRGP